MKRIENTFRNIIWGTVNKFIILFLPFVMRTMIIKILGVEYVGLGSLFTSLLQVLNLAELGIGAAITFSLYKPIAEKDEKMICALMNLYKKVYRIIGIIVLVIGLIILPFLPNLIKGEVPNNINIYYLYMIYLINTVLTYWLFAYKTILLTVNQRSDIISNISSVLYILQYMYQIIVIAIWKNYYLYIIITPIITILNNLIGAYMANKKYPNYICKGVLPKDKEKDIRKRVYGLILQKICATTRNSLDSIFISSFIGLSMVAVYNNYYMIMDAIVGFLAIITSSMTASVGNSIAVENIEKNYNDMNKMNFIYMWIAGWATICLACLYQPFMQIWLGKQYMFSYITVVLFCIYFYSLKMGDIISTYSQGAGLWWEGKYRAAVEAILNIILNYILGKKYGVNGVIAGTLISLLTINFGYGSTIIFKYYFKGKEVLEYFKFHAMYASVTIFIAIVTYMLCGLMPDRGIGYLIIKGIICLIIPNILYVLLYRKTKYYLEAKEFFKNILKKIPKLDKMIKV